MKLVDKSNGFVYGGLFEGNESIMTVQETETGIGQRFFYNYKFNILSIVLISKRNITKMTMNGTFERGC